MKWQPIETAPKDGTEIIVARFLPGGMVYGRNDHWHDEYGFWCDCHKDFPPTHWMPLPEPPK